MAKNNSSSPQLVILAGPNGAGKTTCSTRLLPDGVPFINADEIAKGLSGYEGISQDLRASRILLERVSGFEKSGHSFAIETNLANRALLQRIKRLQEKGYSVTLIFLWLQSVDLAIDRVMERVRRGGHSVPAEVIKRRYRVGLSNFLEYYHSQVDSWFFFDNSMGDTHMAASCEKPEPEKIFQNDLWTRIKKGAKHE
jgi:predicted ABC-type ATPase